MNSGCGINPTTLLFPSTTTIVERMCVSFSSNRSILYPSSSVSRATTTVSWRACVCTLHALGSWPDATHSMTMSRSELVPRSRRSLGLSTTGTTDISLARISNATSALVAPAAATNGSGIMISRASMARNVTLCWCRGTAMPISQRELKDLVAAGLIDAGTAERIAAQYTRTGPEPPRFDLTHTSYYLGALAVMSALGGFMNQAWARSAGGGLPLY